MKPAFDLDLEPFQPGDGLGDALVEDLPQLVLLGPDRLPDFLDVLRVPIVFLTDEAAQLLEVPILLCDLPQVVPQVDGVVRLMRRRGHEDAMRADLSVAVKAVKVVLVVVQGALRLGDR